MTTSADIRKDNKKRIYKQMLDRKPYTKQRIASITGLSVATCNTLLNDMLASGVLSIGSEKELHGVGRGSALYSVNDRHECYLLVILSARNRQKTVECSLVSATGDIIRQNRSAHSVLNPADILKMMKDTANGYPHMNQIVISVPGVVDGDEITFCDIRELEGTGFVRMLRAESDKIISIENDLHCIACGYAHETQAQDAISTLAVFSEQMMPGTVTMYKGRIIRGHNGIAGLAGFMPLGIAPDELPKRMTGDGCRELIARITGAVITFLNPGEMVFSGDLVSEEVLGEVAAFCEKSIPAKYLPTFRIVPDFDRLLLKGMFWKAVENKQL